MSDLLIARNLSKRFGDFVAVNGVDVRIQKGVLASIIGPNGAGKTTFVNLVTGYLMPDSGRVFFKGEDITKLPPHIRVKKGLVRSFQIINIFRRLTAYENILLSVLSRLNKTTRLLSDINDHRDAVEETERILDELGLLEKKDIRAGELSHGDQKILEIGIAIALNPELCFLDEPTAGTSPLERIKIVDLIKELHEKGRTTFVIIEHDMDVVFSLSEKIFVMHQGKIIAEGEPKEIKDNRDVREAYLGVEI